MSTIYFKTLNENAVTPTRAHSSDAGLDLYASERVFIPLGATVKIPTGLAAAIPDGTYVQIADRSGLASKGLRTGAGVIDSTYRGELMIVMHNLNFDSHTYIGEMGYMVQKGDKIAQALHVPVLLSEVVLTETLPKSVRGINGFGSTGM